MEIVINIIMFLFGIVVVSVINAIKKKRMIHGKIVITQNDSSDSYELRFVIDKPYKLIDKNQVMFKIEKSQ